MGRQHPGGTSPIALSSTPSVGHPFYLVAGATRFMGHSIHSCCKMLQGNGSKEWDVALSTVRPITQTQKSSWGQRVAESIKHSSSNIYRCAPCYSL